MRFKEDIHVPVGTAFRNATPSKDYLYRENTAIRNTTMVSSSSIREDRYTARKNQHDHNVKTKKQEEDVRNRHLLVLKKKENAEERLNNRQEIKDNRLQTLWNDPLHVVSR